MILDQITLRDFGVYAGLHEIDLAPPSTDRPIIVFGGLNGTGKTTLMDALQLCLFGSAAKCLSQNGVGYKDFLISRIHKSASSKQSSVSVRLRCNEGDTEASYHVTRNWQYAHNGVKEQLQVTRDNCAEKSLTENWSYYVNDIIPVNISHLFFFDGEKIATYATPKGIRELVANGVRSLFGIDVIERLQKDLRVLERRRAMTVPSANNTLIAQKEKEIQSLHNSVELMKEKRTSLKQKELYAARTEFASVMQEYHALGGDLRERREEIQHRMKQAEANLNSCYNEMTELASGELPLLLIRDLLQEAANYATQEQKIKEARTMMKNLHERDNKMLALIKNLPDTSAVVKALEEFCRGEMAQQEKLARCKTLINISDADIHRLNTLLQDKLLDAEKNVETMLVEFRNSEDEMKAAKFAQQGIPPDDAINEIIKKRDLLIAQIAQLENELSGLESEIEKKYREIERLEAGISSLLEKNAESELAHKDIARFMQHSLLAGQILEKFGAAVLGRKIGLVENLALESYQSLLRKDKLVASLQIDPNTFDIVLKDRTNNLVSVEQLSAGERQLLVVALLWGMAKASGKLLPIAIDTPMGRLDSTHRDRLVDQYFPYASHQLLLFTTDEEIDENYLCHLEQWIGKSYYLSFNDETGATVISDRSIESA